MEDCRRLVDKARIYMKTFFFADVYPSCFSFFAVLTMKQNDGLTAKRVYVSFLRFCVFERNR